MPASDADNPCDRKPIQFNSGYGAFFSLISVVRKRGCLLFVVRTPHFLDRFVLFPAGSTHCCGACCRLARLRKCVIGRFRLFLFFFIYNTHIAHLLYPTFGFLELNIFIRFCSFFKIWLILTFSCAYRMSFLRI